MQVGGVSACVWGPKSARKGARKRPGQTKGYLGLFLSLFLALLGWAKADIGPRPANLGNEGGHVEVRLAYLGPKRRPS